MSRLKLFGEGQPEGGTTDHSALANLSYAQSGHTGFVPSQGEALIEILRLTQNTIRDSGGNNRITLSPTSPHMAVAGDLRVSQHAALADATPDTGKVLNVMGTLDTYPVAVGIYSVMRGNRATGAQYTYGLSGAAVGQGSPDISYVFGLRFYAEHDSPGSCYQLCGINIQQRSGASGTGAIPAARGIHIPSGYWAGSKPTTAYGLDIEDQGGSGVGTAYGLRILDQTASSVRLLELGPTTPYLRLLGGGDPPTNKSNLYLKFGSTLYRVVKLGSYMALEAA
jgi:hypothetical protein